MAEAAPSEGHKDFLILKAAVPRNNSLTDINKGVSVTGHVQRLNLRFMKHTSESLKWGRCASLLRGRLTALAEQRHALLKTNDRNAVAKIPDVRGKEKGF